jgi:hypothetical protein
VAIWNAMGEQIIMNIQYVVTALQIHWINLHKL